MSSNKDSDPVITSIINQIDRYLKDAVSGQLDLAVVSDQLRGNIKYLKNLISEGNFTEGDGLLEGHGSLIKAYNLAGSFENDKKWILFNEYFATASSNLVKYNNTLLTKSIRIKMQPDKTIYLSSSDLIDFIQKNFNLKTTDTTIKSGGKTLVLTIEMEKSLELSNPIFQKLYKDLCNYIEGADFAQPRPEASYIHLIIYPKKGIVFHWDD